MEKKDSRIIAYREAVEAMCRGEFIKKIPVGDDEIGQLGKSIQKLSIYLQQQFEKNQSLYRIMVESNLNLRINDVLNHIFESFSKFIPYDRISLTLLEHEGNTLKLHWARANYELLKSPTGFSTSLPDCAIQEIIDAGELRVINDLDRFLKKNPQSNSAKIILGEGIRSSVICPLIATGKTIGFIFFSSRKRNIYKNLHQDLFLQLASQLSVIVEKSKLYKMVKINKQLMENKKKLEERVTHDALTGILNRPAIFEVFRKQITRAKRNHFGIAVIMIDIDHFKEINDSCGHVTGDAVLCKVTQRLLASARSNEQIGRFGGEEFLAILSPCDKEGALKAAERLRVAVACKEFSVAHGLIPVTISLGVAISSELSTLDEKILLHKADEALYTAKNNGRNRVEIAMP